MGKLECGVDRPHGVEVGCVCVVGVMHCSEALVSPRTLMGIEKCLVWRCPKCERL